VFASSSLRSIIALCEKASREEWISHSAPSRLDDEGKEAAWVSKGRVFMAVFLRKMREGLDCMPQTGAAEVRVPPSEV